MKDLSISPNQNSSRLEEDILVSIFYDLNTTPQLINHLRFLLSKKEITINYANYYIFFNDLKGDHITLFLKNITNAGIIKNQITNSISKYLKIHPSHPPTIKHPLTTFFCSFPTNTFKFNIDIYPLLMIKKTGELSDMRFLVSQYIMSVFSSNPIDRENKFSFLVHLQYGIYKAYSENLQEVHEIATTLLKHTDDIKLSPNSFDLTTDTNHRIFQIFNEFFQPDYSKELDWLEDWIQYFKNALLNKSFNHLFILTSQIIVEHLGLPSNNEIIEISTKIILMNSTEYSFPKNT